jgi:hypothetical protein
LPLTTPKGPSVILTQCLRRRLSEQRAVRNREAPKLPKAMVGHNLRDGCRGGFRTRERPRTRCIRRKVR